MYIDVYSQIVFKNVERHHLECHVSFQFLRKVSNYPSWVAPKWCTSGRKRWRGNMLGYISRGHSKEVKDQKVYLNIYGNYM